MTDREPIEHRSLSSFADHIITRQTVEKPADKERWNAVFDRGLVVYEADHTLPGGATAATREGASKEAAAEIRARAAGASVPQLFPGPQLARYMRHWDKKERFEALGIDPDEMYSICRETRSEVWKLDGDWRRQPGVTRSIEFYYQLLIAEFAQSVANDVIDIEEGRNGIVEAIKEAFDAGHYEGAVPTTKTWELLGCRLDQVVNELSSAPAISHEQNGNQPRI
ncbi:hypothetical protein HFN89_05745 [Rhizobium laguerreae]|nr:hypothetical protein [Rhizobium laguerreae]